MTLLGLGAAVLAEIGSIGLLGISGWFIASCAIAGMTAYSTFSYVAPSAAVRGFALLRVTANYVQRLLLHRGALKRLHKVRLEFFAATADASAVAAPVRGGRLLDRAMADADAESMHLIRTIQPIVVYIVLSLCTVIVVAVVSAPAAVVLAGACALAVLLALAADRMRGTRATRSWWRPSARRRANGAGDGRRGVARDRVDRCDRSGCRTARRPDRAVFTSASPRKFP